MVKLKRINIPFKYGKELPFKIKNGIIKYKKLIENFAEQEIKLRKSCYVGRGRPKKTDFTMVKIKDLSDFQACELLNSGFDTNYTKLK